MREYIKERLADIGLTEKDFEPHPVDLTEVEVTAMMAYVNSELNSALIEMIMEVE